VRGGRSRVGHIVRSYTDRRQTTTAAAVGLTSCGLLCVRLSVSVGRPSHGLTRLVPVASGEPVGQTVGVVC